jgi:sigma-B regulation protein RsbU (phosphoserine phosphatase)
VLAALDAECAVPILTRRRTLVGVLLVGARLSDEPYSREDRRLLSSVASQAGTALDNLILAEEMAERLEADRRARQEVEIAAEVQRRLLPSRTVPMATIEYVGHCVQARAVGGDYYDFLDFGPKRMGLALGDVSGKGLYAALLTTHLQASVRGLAMRLATEDLASVLADVNRSFSESTARNHFATFFIGRYEDDTRRLSYANCGHLPPMIARGDGTLERLGVTASAIGLLDEWTGAVGQVVLNRGDVLAVFSDGVTEAMNREGDEFGEARLADVLVSSRGRPASEIADRVILEVKAFSGGDQHDDLTLVVVRGR